MDLVVTPFQIVYTGFRMKPVMCVLLMRVFFQASNADHVNFFFFLFSILIFLFLFSFEISDFFFFNARFFLCE